MYLPGGGNTPGLGRGPWEGQPSQLPSKMRQQAQRSPETGHPQAVRAEQPSWWREGLPVPTSLIWAFCPPHVSFLSLPGGMAGAGTWGRQL